MPRRKKEDYYAKERRDLIDRLLLILDLDDRNSFTLYELDNDSYKQRSIMSLLEEIKLYFTFGNIHPERAKRPYLMVLRNVLKTEYNMYSIGAKDDKIVKDKYFIRYYLERRK